MSYWNVKIYDGDTGDERETIRGLTLTQKGTLMKALDREGVQAQAMQYDDEGTFIEGGGSVNWPDGPAALHD